MKIAIVSSSKVFASGRWDAGFHILVQQHEAQANEIKAAMMKAFEDKPESEALKLAAKQCTDLLDRMPTGVLAEIAELSSGQKTESRQSLTMALMEYPFLAMAIVKASGKLEAFQAEKQKEASDASELVEQMTKLNSPAKAPSKSPKP